MSFKEMCEILNFLFFEKEKRQLLRDRVFIYPKLCGEQILNET